jgi:hypothetical protein
MSATSSTRTQGDLDSTIWLPPKSPEIMAAIGNVANSCPHSGVHQWLFIAALKLHALNLSDPDIECVLEQATAGYHRAMKPNEIEDAVRNSRDHIGDPEYRPSPWPIRDYDEIFRVVSSGPSAADLQARLPSPEDDENWAEPVIDALFPGNPLLCVGKSTYDFRTKAREEWRGWMRGQQLIVPSAMIAQFGTTKDGKKSEHCLSNTGERLFLGVEFDFKAITSAGDDWGGHERWLMKWAKDKGKTEADLCAALHAHLSGYRRLALVVHSGGRSLHGWYPCQGETKERLERFMRFAVSLGADPATWTKSQFVRVPDGKRNNGKRQRILYFNPAALSKEAA